MDTVGTLPGYWLAAPASPASAARIALPDDVRPALPLRPLVTLVAAYWAVIVGIDFLNDWLLRGLAGPLPPLSRVATDLAVWWSAWLVLTPAVVAIALRVEPGRVGWPRSVAAHLGLAVGFGLAHFVLASYAFEVVATSRETPWFRVGRFIGVFTLPQCLTYFGLIAAIYVGALWRRSRIEGARSSGLAQRTSHLEGVMGRAELRALGHQLETHLLLNGLNSVSALARTGDRDGTVDMLAELGDLVRSVATASRGDQITLARELENVARYVSFERRRHHDHLEVTYDVDPAVSDALVPPLLLQPVIENAIVHGRAPSGPRVAVSARVEGARLRIEIRDHGATTTPAHRTTTGTGLANTRARLALLHGDAARLDLDRLADGARCVIELPIVRGRT